MNQKKIGTILSFGSIIIKLMVTFFYTPFVLSYLTKAEYGIFSVIGALISYITILDFGINDSTLRYFVKYKIEKSETIKSKILGSISSIYIILSLLVIIICCFIYYYIPLIFKNGFSIEEIEILKKMFIISSISIFFTILFNPIGAILNAYEKFIVLKSSDIIIFILTTISISIFLLFGYNLIMMVSISAILNITNILFKFIYVRKKLKIKFPTFNYSKDLVKNIALYASPIFLVIIVEQIYWKLDNILIGAISGTELVTYYAIGIVFQKYILSFSTSISRIMTPSLISKIDLNSSIKELTINYIKTSRIQLVVVLLIVLNLVFWGKDFLQIWLGDEYSVSYTIMMLIMIPFSIEIIGNLRNVFLQVYNYYWFRGIILLVISIFNIILTIYLLKLYGISGAAISTCIGLVIGYIATNILLHKKVKLNLLLFFKQVWLKSVPIILLTIVFYYLTNQFINITNWITLIISVSITSIVYIILIWLFYLDSDEKKYLKINKHGK